MNHKIDPDHELVFCTVCKLAEGSLTSECPGHPVANEKYNKDGLTYDEAVYRGLVDFKEGKWQDSKVSPHSPARHMLIRAIEEFCMKNDIFDIREFVPALTVVGFVLNRNNADPKIQSMSITSDGFIIANSKLFGKAEYIEELLDRLMELAEFTDNEKNIWSKLYTEKVLQRSNECDED